MKSEQLNNRLLAFALIVAATLLLGACATSSAPPAAQAEATAAEEPAPEIEPWDGYGLEIPLDGSSMEAWERSLLRVEAYSEPADYELLLSAIDYLRVYDLGARGKMDLLIARLDGQTGYQILSRVKYRGRDPVVKPGEKRPSSPN